MSRVVRAAAVVGALPGAVRLGLAARRPRSGPIAPPPAPAAPPGRGVRVARGVLIGTGTALLLTGAVFEFTVSKPMQIPGVLLWLAAAVVLHDAVLSPIVFVADLALRQVGRRVPAAAIAVVQIAVVVGVVLTFIAVPAIRAKQLGARNPSVLVGDYGPALLGLLIGLAVLTALLLGVLVVRARARARRAADLSG